VAKFDEQLAALAAKSAKSVAGIGGASFFSIRGGRLSFGGNTIPGNEMAVVVVADVLVNTYYKEDFDAENPVSPDCYAFGGDATTMKPHEAVAKPQCEQCKGCPQNEFGTAKRGKGKACKNGVRLALIDAGKLKNGSFEPKEDPEEFKGGAIGFFNVPPTSLKAWGSYVRGLLSFKKVPAVVFTKVTVEPDEKTQVKVSFTLLDDVPNELKPVLLERNASVQSDLVAPYPEREEAPKKPLKKRKF
jgi:hypothetical protein